MNTLRQAVQDYLSLRRGLGFKLHEAGKGLLDFATFMEQRRASYITQALALAWVETATSLGAEFACAHRWRCDDAQIRVPRSGVAPSARVEH